MKMNFARNLAVEFAVGAGAEHQMDEAAIESGPDGEAEGSPAIAPAAAADAAADLGAETDDVDDPEPAPGTPRNVQCAFEGCGLSFRGRKQRLRHYEQVPAHRPTGYRCTGCGSYIHTYDAHRGDLELKVFICDQHEVGWLNRKYYLKYMSTEHPQESRRHLCIPFYLSYLHSMYILLSKTTNELIMGISAMEASTVLSILLMVRI